MNYLLGLLFLTALLFACADPAADRKNGFSDPVVSKEDSLLKEVMEGHDLAMAKMSKIFKYKKRARATIDSMVQVPAAKKDLDKISVYRGLLDQLTDADISMNQWMDGFKRDSATGNPPVRIEYLEQERMKVLMVKQKIFNSLALADSLYNQ